MTIDKKISYEVQGGAKNYLGKQKQVTAPIKWKSSPDSPETELAYITKAEKDLLVKKDIHGSLKGDVNRGPSGIMSLDGYGSFDDPSDTSRDTGMSGTATSAAETGSRNAMDVRDIQAQLNTANLGPSTIPTQAQDLRNAFIVAGGGQRVNPGFFDSRNTISPQELALARASNPRAFDKIRGGGGILGFIRGGGIIGNLIRGLGQKLGFGKKYDEPTYDMRGLNTRVYENILEPSTNPEYYNDLGNELMLSTKASPNVAKGFVTATGTNYPGANKFLPVQETAGSKNIFVGRDLGNFGLDGYLTDEMFEEQFGTRPKTSFDYDPNRVFKGIYSLPEKEDFLGNTSEDYKITPNQIGGYVADAETDNEKLLKQLLNPDLGVDEFIDDQKKKKQREQELLEELKMLS